MAMTKCRECGKDVSSKAAACPSCGNPIRTKPSGSVGTGTGCLVIVIAGALMVAFLGGIPDGPGTSSSPAPPRLSDAECRKDLACWADRHHVDATIACKKAIHAQAKWQFEWTDGLLEREFDRYGWADQQKTAVTYFGDKLKMQNGFGAWKNMRYGCTYDPTTRRVVEAVVE